MLQPAARVASSSFESVFRRLLPLPLLESMSDEIGGVLGESDAGARGGERVQGIGGEAGRTREGRACELAVGLDAARERAALAGVDAHRVGRRTGGDAGELDVDAGQEISARIAARGERLCMVEGGQGPHLAVGLPRIAHQRLDRLGTGRCAEHGGDACQQAGGEEAWRAPKQRPAHGGRGGEFACGGTVCRALAERGGRVRNGTRVKGMRRRRASRRTARPARAGARPARRRRPAPGRGPAGVG